MRVGDEAVWQERRAALSADETGRKFLHYLETWADHAESRLAQNRRELEHIHGGETHEMSVSTALRISLSRVEESCGRADVLMLGQMMAVMAMHWREGAQMMASLTPIERRLVEDMVAAKIANEQAKAATVPNG